MLVASLAARDFRSLEQAELELGPGITSVVGEIGTGKTNLLEAIYFALSGRSFRARDRRELIRFGEAVGRAEVAVADERAAIRCSRRSRAPRAAAICSTGSPPPSPAGRPSPAPGRLLARSARARQGPPAERRAHLDLFIAARWPSRAGLRRITARCWRSETPCFAGSPPDVSPELELDAWDQALPTRRDPADRVPRRGCGGAGAALRRGGSAARPRAGAAALRAARGSATPEALRAGLAERRESDLRAIADLAGPPPRRARAVASRPLLAPLRLSRRTAHRPAGAAVRRARDADRRRVGAPLLLLDDVMSELDPAHRELLAIVSPSGARRWSAPPTSKRCRRGDAAGRSHALTRRGGAEGGGLMRARRSAPRVDRGSRSAAARRTADRLALVQTVWADAVGAAIAAQAEPVAEREGVLDSRAAPAPPGRRSSASWRASCWTACASGSASAHRAPEGLAG